MPKVSNIRWRVAQFLEFRWWDHYLRRKATEIYKEQKKAYWKAILAQTGSVPTPGQTALDAGCGPSGMYMVLSGLQVDAVDPLLDQYAAGLDIFQPRDYPWTTFHPVPMEHWEAVRAYDWIFCMNALNHFRDPDTALAKMREAIAPGGHLLLAVDAHTSAWLPYLFRALPGDILHPHQFDAEGYRQMLSGAGFVILQETVWKKGRIFDYVLFRAITIPN